MGMGSPIRRCIQPHLIIQTDTNKMAGRLKRGRQWLSDTGRRKEVNMLIFCCQKKI